MISVEQRGPKQDWRRMKMYGKSTDEKPTRTYEGEDIGNGSTFYEMDTHTVYMYDEEDHTWIRQ